MRIIEFCLVLILTKMDPEKEQHSLLKGTSHDLGANQAMTIFKNLQRQDYPSKGICDFNTKGPTTEVNLRLRDVFERQNRFNIDLTRNSIQKHLFDSSNDLSVLLSLNPPHNRPRKCRKMEMSLATEMLRSMRPKKKESACRWNSLQ